MLNARAHYPHLPDLFVEHESKLRENLQDFFKLLDRLSILDKEKKRDDEKINKIQEQIKDLRQIIRTNRVCLKHLAAKYKIQHEDKGDTSSTIHFNRSSTLIHKLLWLAPIFGTLASTAELAVAMNQIQDDKKLFDKVDISYSFSMALQYVVPLIYFLQMANMNWRYTLAGITTTVDVMRLGQIPRASDDEANEWPVLSNKKEKIAIAISVPFALFPSIAGALSTYYFMQQLPEIYDFRNEGTAWKSFAVITAVLRCVENLMSESLLTYRELRQLLAGHGEEKSAHANSFTVSKILGYPLGIMGLLQDTLELYFTMGLIFSISSKSDKWFLLTSILMFNGPPDFAYHGQMSIQAFKKFFESLTNGFTKRDAITFIVTAFFSLCVAEAFRQLIVKMSADPEFELPFAMPPRLIHAVSALTGIQEGVNGIYNNYGFFRYLPENIGHGLKSVRDNLSWAGNKIASAFTCCRKRGNYQVVDEEKSSELFANNRYSLYASMGDRSATPSLRREGINGPAKVIVDDMSFRK